MYKEGHAGLSFLLFSPFMFLTKVTGVDTTNVLITGLVMVALSSIPDLDMQWELKHRGVTHTFLFGIGVGVFFGLLFGFGMGTYGYLMGFLAGFGGTASHLLGDVFTYMSFKPYYPFSDKEVALKLFKASNRTINFSFFLIGLILFILSYEPTIITAFLG